jgi:hypothetical protein
MLVMSRQPRSSSQYLAKASFETSRRANSRAASSASTAEGKRRRSPASDQAEQGIRHAAAADSTTASRGSDDALDDVGDPVEIVASATLAPKFIRSTCPCCTTPTSADAFIAPELYKLMNCGANPPDSPEL